MKINIGDNNKIEKSNIGQNNSKNDCGNDNFRKIVMEIVVGVLIAAISGYILFMFGWN